MPTLLAAARGSWGETFVKGSKRQDPSILDCRSILALASSIWQSEHCCLPIWVLQLLHRVLSQCCQSLHTQHQCTGDHVHGGKCSCDCIQLTLVACLWSNSYTCWSEGSPLAGAVTCDLRSALSRTRQKRNYFCGRKEPWTCYFTVQSKQC